MPKTSALRSSKLVPAVSFAACTLADRCTIGTTIDSAIPQILVTNAKMTAFLTSPDGYFDFELLVLYS